MEYYGYYENKYNNAVKSGNQDILEYFRQFGDETHCIQNACHYEACKECGFTEPFHVNEYGWCDNGKLKIETVPVFDGREYAQIHVAQLPNKRWVGECSISITNRGMGCMPSVFSESYETKDAAIKLMVCKINDFIRRNAKFPEVYLKETDSFWKNFNNEQLTLF